MRNFAKPLQPGEKHLFGGRLDTPEVSLVGEGRLTYLWVGGAGCVGTLEGRALRSVANEILRRIDKKRGRSLIPAAPEVIK